MHDVIVVGGGVIGLSVAHALSVSGKSVVVLDSGEPTDAASWAAAGMLAPQSEADRPDPLFGLCSLSRTLYREWCAQLQAESGIDPEYKETGLIYVATSEDALDMLKRRMNWQQAAGFDSELLTADEIGRREPTLTMPAVGGVYIPAESQVVPRRLLQALRQSCIACGVEIQNGQPAREIVSGGVRTDAGIEMAATVVIASGARSSEIAGLNPRPRVVPRKGQILSLATPVSLFRTMIRWEHAYMLQRAGELIVGATNEDAGFDRRLTPAGIGSLLARVQQMAMCTATLPIQEMWSGLRPATPDGMPLIGYADKWRDASLIYATGHYRNGVLLAPITAAIVTALADGRPSPVPLEPFAPLRFEV